MNRDFFVKFGSNDFRKPDFSSWSVVQRTMSVRSPDKGSAVQAKQPDSA